MSKTPVLISAYNRPSKLDACLASLVRCEHFDKRQIHLTIDAAADPSQRDLVAQCRALAVTYSDIYRNIVLYFPETNTQGNVIQTTIDTIFLNSSTLIALEDDNILHNNFLNYMDHQLKVNQPNKNVFAICGYSFPVEHNFIESDVFLWQGHNAWGTGYYRDRWTDFKLGTKDSAAFLENYLLDIRVVFKRQKIAGHFLRSAMATYLRSKDHKDILTSIYLAQNSMFNVFPKQSLVQNTGHDGSGTNNKKITSKYNVQEFKSDNIDIFSTPIHSKIADRILRVFFQQPLSKRFVDYPLYLLIYLSIYFKCRVIGRK